LTSENVKKETAGYENIRQFLLNKKNLINFLGIILIVYTAFLLIRICASVFGNISMPNEYREAANIQLTQTIMKGINPYSLKSYEGDLPGMIYVYGPLYSVFTALLGLIFPIDIITLHYVVTFAAVLISAALSAVMVYKRTEYLAAPAAVFLFIINCNWRYGYINAVPDSFALMIAVIIIFIMSLKDFRLKNFLCALLSIMLFFVKQYFAVIAAAIFIFKLINDRKDCLKFFINGLVISLITFIAVSLTCPLYWTYSIYLAHGPFGITQEQYHAAYGGYMKEYTKEELEQKEQKRKEQEEKLKKENIENFTAESVNTDPDSGFGYEILQLRSLAGIFIFVFLATLMGILRELKTGFKDRKDFMFFLVIYMVVSFTALIYLGRNNGAWLSYYLQLLMPEVIIYAFITVDRLLGKDDKRIAVCAFGLLFLMIFFTAYRTNGRLKVYEKDESQLLEWTKAYDIAARYAEKGEVYYVPLLGFQTFSNGQYLYNNGHSMVITGFFRGEFFAVPWEQKVFPNGGMVLNRHYAYQEHIKEKVAKQDYELVTIIDGVDTDAGRLGIADLKEAGYHKEDSCLLNAGRMNYEVQFWVK